MVTVYTIRGTNIPHVSLHDHNKALSFTQYDAEVQYIHKQGDSRVGNRAPEIHKENKQIHRSATVHKK
jgi:hypothetical protein